MRCSLLTFILNEVSSLRVTKHQTSAAVLTTGEGSVPTPTWRVTMRSRRGFSEAQPPTSATVEADAEARGVSLHIDSLQFVVRFLVGGADLRAATVSALDRWDVIHRELCLPGWRATSMVVTQLPFEPPAGDRVGQSRVCSHPAAPRGWVGALIGQGRLIQPARDAFGAVPERRRKRPAN
jgi:hypothetical protein